MLYLVFVAFLVATTTQAQSLRIEISEPTDGVKVAQKQYVKGMVSDPEADVLVVIHPVETSGFWVQPPVTVKSNGTWRVKAHFGRAGMDSGKEFEIRAFANPEGMLREGKSGSWPKAAARSDVADVIRE